MSKDAKKVYYGIVLICVVVTYIFSWFLDGEAKETERECECTQCETSYKETR